MAVLQMAPSAACGGALRESDGRGCAGSNAGGRIAAQGRDKARRDGCMRSVGNYLPPDGRRPMRNEISALTGKPVIIVDQDVGVTAMVGIDVYLIAIVVRRMGEWDSDRHCCQDEANPKAH